MNVKEYLDKRAIILGMQANDSEEVIRALGGKLRKL
jgi:hypothetical protein